MKLKIEHGFHYRYYIQTILNGNIKIRTIKQNIDFILFRFNSSSKDVFFIYLKIKRGFDY